MEQLPIADLSLVADKVYQMAAAMAKRTWKTRKKMATRRTKVVKAQQHCRICTIMAYNEG